MNPENPILKYVHPRKLVWPIVLGIGIAIYFINQNGRTYNWEGFSWTKNAWLWFTIVFFLLCFREIGYAIRLRVLSSKLLSWRACFQLTFLWELASALSPGAIGGTAVALVLLAQEKIKAGTSTAIVLATSFLDELFFIVLVPVVFFTVGTEKVFEQLQNGLVSSSGMMISFIIGYSVLLLWTLILGIGLFVKPIWMENVIRFTFKRSRWGEKAKQFGQDLVVASLSLKNKPFVFWIKGFGSTAFSWLSRYAVINFLFLTVNDVQEHMLIYAKQLVMWVMLMVPVSPGASGLAEVVFSNFFKSYLPGQGTPQMMALLWRGISYYPLIIVGLITLYFWVKRLQSTASSVSSG